MDIEELNKEIPVQTGMEKTDKNAKPKVIVTLLKATGYVLSYYLLMLFWIVVLVLFTFFQHRSDFGDARCFFLQDADARSRFIGTIIIRTKALKWYGLAAGVSWLLLLFVFFRVRKQPFLERTGLKRCAPVFLLVGVLSGIGSRMFIDGIYILWPKLTGWWAVASFKQFFVSDPNSVLSALPSTLAFGSMAPIAEEIVFRGISFQHLKRIWQVPVAAAVISVCFGLWHYHEPLIFMTFMAFWSILLCLTAHRSGSIVPTILCHLIFNLSVIFHVITGIRTQKEMGAWIFVLGILLLIGGILLLIRFKSSTRTTG